MSERQILTRQQLATFLKTHDLIKAFEQIFGDVNITIPANQQATDLALSLLESRINSFFEELQKIIDENSLVPRKEFSFEPEILPPLQPSLIIESPAPITIDNNLSVFIEDIKGEIGTLFAKYNSILSVVEELRGAADIRSQSVDFLASLNDVFIELGALAAKINGNIAALLAYQPLSSVLTALSNTSTYPLMNYGGYKFDGSAIYLDGNPLGTSGVDLILDSKAGTLFFVHRFANAATADETIIDNAGSSFRIIRRSTGAIQILAENAAGTQILLVQTTAAVCLAAGTYRVALSWDLATAGSTHIAVDNVLQALNTPTTDTNDTIDYSVAEWSIGANSGGTARFTAGDMYTLWFDPTARLDLSVASNLYKFVAPDLKPVFLGWQGELPTGYQPVLFLGYDSYTNWFRNRGSAVSTGFTEHGTPAAVTTPLYGQYAGGRNGNKVRIITAAGAVYVGIADDTVGINKTVGAATVVNLKKATGTGKRYTIVDVKGDANANNITLTPPSGTINGAATFVMNVNYQSIIVQDMATDVYMVV